MSFDIHPHWKSTDVPESPHDAAPAAEGSLEEGSFFKAGEERETPRSIQHIPITQSGWPLSASLGITLLSLCSLGFLFLYGITLIRADLLGALREEFSVTMDDGGFSEAEISVFPEGTMNVHNASSLQQQFQTDQRRADGSPIIATSLIPAGGDAIITIPLEAAGRTLTLRSALVPTIVVTLVVEAQKQENPEEPETVSTGEETDSVTQGPLPSIPVVTVSPTPVPSDNVIPPLPTLPSQTAMIPPSSVINIGSAVANTVIGSPQLLRVNRFTVGSPLVPSLSPTMQLPVHAVARAEDSLYSTLRHAPPRQPQTGPALSLMTMLTVAVMPLLFRSGSFKRSRKDL